MHHRRRARFGSRLTAAVLALLLAQHASAWQAILNIRVVEGEAAVHPVGARASRPLIVQVTDETGAPVSGVAVSFRLPDDGPSGVFDGGLKTGIAVTGPDGRAAARNMRWNTTEGPFRIRITASKGEARAGTVSEQYLSAKLPSAGPGSGGRSRWRLIGVAAAAAGVGLAIGFSRGSGGDDASPGTPPQIGSPTITVGRP